MDGRGRKGIGSFFVAGLISCGLFYQQAQAAGFVNGNITFTDTVTLDTDSAGTATMVTAWGGIGGVGLPRVQTVDGDFATFVTPSHGTTFFAPWSFNYAGPTITSFWSVDGFQFDLNASSIPMGGQGFDAAGGFVSVNGAGTVSGHGFDSTPGTFNFSTQDPSGEGLFSFSAATGAVPEPGTILMVLSGASLLGAFLFICRRRA